MSIQRLSAVAAALVLAIGAAATALLTAGADKPDDMILTAADRTVLHRAEQRLIKQCMTAAGFEYVEKPPPVESFDRRFPYVIDDVAWAKANGYGPRPEDRAPDPTGNYLKIMPADRQRAWQRALVGSNRSISVDMPNGGRLSTADNGCQADARRALYADLEDWYRARRTVDGLTYQVYGEVRKAPQFETSRKKWSACVRATGYPADDPGRLVEPTDPRATRDQAALVEATCAVSSGFGPATRALHTQHLTQISAEHRRTVQDLDALEHAALPRAKAVLGNS
ncbi:hypothetical protein ACQPXM_07270 [Kribbella sp. CA-253562]|uniref:hypothetical protein n=1 Tax=Kribbella sp. CA-253562 TaxID=3239942 RepID=UPI003D8FFC8D